MFRDASGLPVFPADALEKMAAKSGAPVYGMYGTYIGRGIAAGRVIDYQEMGQRAADMGADLLRGKVVPLSTIQQTIGSHCVADYPPMAAHGLSVSALPTQCEVKNLPRNLWTQYRSFVLGVIAVIVLQGLTIAALLEQSRRRRAAEQMSSRQRIELARAMRFAAMGELTASIAHEINQPLGAILSNAQAGEILLAKDAATPDQMHAILSDIRRDIERSHTVITRLRALLSKNETEHHPVRLHMAIFDVLPILEPEARRRRIKLDLDLAATNDLLSGESVQLQQVVINLALNAMDALGSVEPERRQLTLKTINTEHQICMEVIDTGCGMDESLSSTVFDSFCTTKIDGLGLGLPIVRAIVQAHHGSVSFVTQTGYGSTFAVTLPLYETPP
jgi:signal transduction histidine kinase